MMFKNLETIIFFLTLTIEKKNDRMFEKVEKCIFSSIHFYHFPNEFPHYLIMNYHHAMVTSATNVVHIFWHVIILNLI
jgi:hypothetical protein